MRKTYAAPTLVLSGDVVASTKAIVAPPGDGSSDKQGLSVGSVGFGL